MELQKHKFLILKGHSKVNCPKDFMPDVLSTFFCDAGLKGPNFINKFYKEIVRFLRANFSSNIIPKEQILQIARIFKLFKCLNSFCLSWCFLFIKSYVNEEKCKMIMTSAEIRPYRELIEYGLVTGYMCWS